ncbi:hypothetical protein BT93_L4210 [Corymbia citriodora subsp. variegata]|uniref:TIR domain-containing protein n=1 Tax=Corymbia citriodora subsp. variegata TaxID=360336 RepID=A0A8T0CYJ0_CORYI|nr:hypothetical protein BT93_L4210 [Corymbia citriodora subsp. variegata]
MGSSCSSSKCKRSYAASSSSSNSSNSSSKRKRRYDVFLSFRGTDVRKNFVSHLYTALHQSGIYTFIDNREMRKGEQIQPALMKAIEESQVAIIVFSKNYASSSWCLEEMAKIMECKAQKGLIVLPVFYKVRPTEVRKRKRSYGRAMAKHESKFGKDSHKVKRWKDVLFDVSNLSGWHVVDEDEAELIREIVNNISRQLVATPLHVAKHPVGIHPQVAELNRMLKLASDDDVRMIGLWGPGGIGKTTLSKALYNDIFRQFEGSCFLADVRSEAPKGLVSLQEKLLSEILLGQGLAVSNIHKGITLIQDRLCHKKVLIVLDDVDDVKQLDVLAGGPKWFGEGSTIIFTTRNKHLLTSRGIDKDCIYEVKPLGNRDALALLSREAFLSNDRISEDLVDKALHFANGHPLALMVLGHLLCDRGEREWKSSLQKLSESPNEIINNALKWSYDGLDDYAKKICLDIACFFIGYSREYIMKVLDSYDFDPTIELKVLVEKSLITEEKETLQMCNLIQLMAMDIVRQECPENPGGRSRLWDINDFCSVLSRPPRHLESDALQSIVLILPKPEKICIRANDLTYLRNLKKLIMKNVHNTFQDAINLPDKLKWFEWPECRPCIPKSSSDPEKSTQLDLHESNIHALSKQFEDPKKLESNNFRECPSLVYVPILDRTPNFKEFVLPSSIYKLQYLKGKILKKGPKVLTFSQIRARSGPSFK